MLLLIVGILVVLWALGFFVIHIGSFIHLLLVIALIVLIVKLIRGGHKERD
jgi:hypothetical protein